MTELRLIKGFYADGSPLVYSVHGETHPEFGDAWLGYIWARARTGDIAGTWFNRLVDTPETLVTDPGAARPGWRAPGAFRRPAPALTLGAAAIWRWSDSKPEGYEMKEDEKL